MSVWKSCRCEANTPDGVKCPKCTTPCSNTTFVSTDGQSYSLVEATMLHRLSGWDGAMTGFALWKNIPCYFQSYTFSKRPRSYWLFPLRAAEWGLVMRHGVGSHREVIEKAKSRKPIGFFRMDDAGLNGVGYAAERMHSEIFHEVQHEPSRPGTEPVAKDCSDQAGGLD